MAFKRASKASNTAANAPKMGRPRKDTPSTLKDLLDAISAGANLKDAAVSAGISEDTLERWKNDDPTFAGQVKTAEAKAKVNRIKRINAAGTGGEWQADAWYLERRWPDEFGRKLVLEIKPEDDAMLKKLGISPAEAWMKFMKLLVAQYEQDQQDQQSISLGSGGSESGIIIDQQVETANT